MAIQLSNIPADTTWKLKAFVEGKMLISFLLLFMVAAFFSSWWLLQDTPSEFNSQLATTLMQLAVIGGLGMLADIFFKRLEASRAKATRDDTLRQEMLKRLRTAHGAIARARRLIYWHKSAKTYGEQLRELMIVQSELEEINVDIKTYENLFREDQNDIVENVGKIASYLEEGLNEYGDNYKQKFKDKIGENYEDVEKSLPWIHDFVEGIGAYKTNYSSVLTASKMAMRHQIYAKG